MIPYDGLAEIFAIPQIMVVLVLALIVFGPKRLPELGKQIGTALRDLNKAKNDMMKSFSLDHEPEEYKPPTYDYVDNSYPSYSYNPEPVKPDLTDYTMAGVAPNDLVVEAHVDTKDVNAASNSADYIIVKKDSVPEVKGENNV